MIMKQPFYTIVILPINSTFQINISTIWACWWYAYAQDFGEENQAKNRSSTKGKSYIYSMHLN